MFHRIKMTSIQSSTHFHADRTKILPYEIGITTQFLTPFMCVLIFTHEWRYIKIKVYSERQIFE